MIFFNLFKKPKCEICQIETDEILSVDEKRRHSFCRMHLIQTFSEKFLQATFKMIIYEFQPTATKYTGVVYSYYPVQSLETYGWNKADRQILIDLLKILDQNIHCNKCKSNNIQSLYVSAINAPWNKYGPGPHLDFATLGEKLCLKCALQRLKPILANNPKKFGDAGGLWLPYFEDGYYATTEL